MADNATADEKNFPTPLSNGAVQTLRNILTAPEWAKGVKQQRKAIKLRKLLPRVDVPAGLAQGSAEQDEWGLSTCGTFDIPESLRDIGKQCLKHFSDNAKLGQNEVTIELYDAFGVTE